MIILDTNIISELLRPSPNLSVVSWLGVQPSSQLFTTAVCEAEIRYGVARLETGKRSETLLEAINGIFSEDFQGRILAFDSEAAAKYAEIVSQRDRSGRPISQFDAQISAIARLHDAAVATRNTKDFEGLNIVLINPWEG